MSNRKKIVFVVKGERGKGLGHCYRSLNIAAELNDVIEKQFILTPNSVPGFQFMQSKVADKAKIVDSYDQLIAVLKHLNPDLIVNDILDTSAEYISAQIKLGAPIVNFEDIGIGSLYANRVINAVYSGHCNARELYGYKYIDIRKEFFYHRKYKAQRSAQVNSILLTFGGEDPSDITQNVLQIISKNPILSCLHYKVALGANYQNKNAVAQIIAINNLNAKLYVNTDIAHLMAQIDIAVIANCRTVFEAAFMKIPAVVISANARECLHTFYRTARFPYCGNIKLIDPKIIENHIVELVKNFELRNSIISGLEHFDLENGMKRIKREIITLL